MTWREKLKAFSDPDKSEAIERQLKERRERIKEADDMDRMRIVEEGYSRIVGAAYAGCRLDNFAPRKGSGPVVSRLREIAEDAEPVSMIWIGNVGSGKDHLMAAMIRAKWERGVTIRRDDGADFAGLVRDQIRSDKSEKEFLAQFTSPDIWAISDPDGQRAGITDHCSEWLLRIIDRRVRDGKPIWATVNVSTCFELYQRLGTRIADRLNAAVVLQCNWTSYRKPLEVVRGSNE